MNKRDFIATCKRLIQLAEQYGDDALDFVPPAAADLSKRSKRINEPAKRIIVIVAKNDFAPLEFKNRKDLVEHYKLPASCLSNWPYFHSGPVTVIAENELIRAEAAYLAKFMQDAGRPIKMYGRYRTKHTGGMFHSVNLEDLGGEAGENTVREGALL